MTNCHPWRDEPPESDNDDGRGIEEGEQDPHVLNERAVERLACHQDHERARERDND